MVLALLRWVGEQCSILANSSGVMPPVVLTHPKEKFALLATTVAGSSAIDPAPRGCRVRTSV